MSYTPPQTDFISPAAGAVALTEQSTYYINTAIAVSTGTLPAAASVNEGDLIEIVDNGNASNFNITIATTGADTIESQRDGVAQATFVINRDAGSLILRSDGTSKWIAVSGSENTTGSGEVNTASNVTDGGGVGVFKVKNGLDLEFKSLIAGQLVSITSGTNDLTLDIKWDVTAVKVAAYTALAGEFVPTDSSGGTFTVTLTPAATAGAGAMIEIKDSNNSSSGPDRVVIDGNAAETIDGNLTINLPRNGGVLLVCDGSNWFIA